MILKLPGELSVNTLINEAKRDAALQGCLQHGPRRIYSGLLHHARQQGWKDGAAAHLFKEIYGTWPRDEDRGPPIEPPPAVLEWIQLRPKKSPKRKK